MAQVCGPPGGCFKPNSDRMSNCKVCRGVQECVLCVGTTVEMWVGRIGVVTLKATGSPMSSH